VVAFEVEAQKRRNETSLEIQTRIVVMVLQVAGSLDTEQQSRFGMRAGKPQAGKQKAESALKRTATGR
jgi:hypothetical protein